VLMASDRAENALKVAAEKDPSEKIRLTARKYLVIAKVSPEDLASQLSSGDAQARLDAAEALSLRASSKVLNPLIQASLCDGDPRVRSAALRGLARVGNPIARSVIKSALSRDPDPKVRRTAMIMHILVGGK
jgi:HEAT repeat protein